MIATSSAPVGTDANSASRPSTVENGRTDASTGSSPRAASTSATSPSSTSACVTCALPITFAISPARSSGIVATTIPPARRIPSHAAINAGVFGPCRSTRLPGASRISSTRTRATRPARSRTSS